MPTPPRTSLDAIIAAGLDLLESSGLPGLTMQAVAAAVGVRPPSLYKHVEDRDALIRLVADAAALDLAAHVAGATRAAPRSRAGLSPRTVPSSSAHNGPRTGLAAPADAHLSPGVSTLSSLAHAVRAWAHSQPEAYRLVFSGLGSPDIAHDASAAVLRIGEELAGPGDALNAARLVTAWATGFISMELAGAFKLGGDVDEAFEYGIEHLAAALASA